ncbi:UNVERIFIED_CONTAM: DNA polymerase III subunit epsilon, partial [Salmonella enterica subsp. enterica serovar Weltevreden]
GPSTQPLRVLAATAEELEVHRARLQKIAAKGKCLWADDLPASA